MFLEISQNSQENTWNTWNRVFILIKLHAWATASEIFTDMIIIVSHRSSHRKCPMKKSVLKNCAKFFSNYFVFFVFSWWHWFRWWRRAPAKRGKILILIDVANESIPLKFLSFLVLCKYMFDILEFYRRFSMPRCCS